MLDLAYWLNLNFLLTYPNLITDYQNICTNIVSLP